ncbi:MAG: flagellar export protein FliJ [Desulfobacterales bacterium]|nr:flagellar export protein FliJ [Desulfobacterales bacterium]
MYRFKLEPLLKHRKHLEEACQKELAVLQEALSMETDLLGRLVNRKVEQERCLRRLQNGRPDIDAIVAAIAYIQRLGQEIVAQQGVVKCAQKACDDQRCDLVKALQGRKIMDKLKEKGQVAHKAEEVRSHQNFMNEIAINRFNRDR